MARRGIYSNVTAPAEAVLGSYKTGNSISFKALDPSQKKAPNFDPRIKSLPDVGGHISRGMGSLLRGKIIQVKTETFPIKAGGTPLQRQVNFLYNPETIGATYSFDPSAFPVESQQTEYSIPVLGATGMTVSWQLMFNRMYEVASDPSQENMGVLADVQAIEYLMGSRDGQTVSMTEVMVVFGTTPGLKPFAYTGFLSDVNVSYTRFSRRMIPTVAEVQIAMVRRFVPTDTVAPGDAPVTPTGNGVGVDANGVSLPGRSGDDYRTPSTRTAAPTGSTSTRETSTGRMGGVPI